MLGLPLAFSFAVVGFIGIIFMKGLGPGLSTLGHAPYSLLASYTICAIPLFVLMGQFAFHSKVGRDLFSAGHKWLGHLPGGLFLATTVACTGFAACTGSSVASAATMGTLAFPEMERFHYDRRLAAGSVAAGGALGILIPPSTMFIIYGIITETSISQLFIAGFLPGLLLSALFLVIIFILCKRNPRLGPIGDSFSWKEKMISLTGVWAMLALFLLIMGGLYSGVFAPSEAGTIGAFGAFIIGLARRRLSWSGFVAALLDTARITCFALFTLVGAMIFSTFLTVSGLPHVVSDWVTSLPFPPMVILITILLMYIPLGCVIDCFPMILLTIPIIFPIIKNLGFNPVWFGVLIVVMGEVSLMTPPVGINVYVVQGVTNVPLEDVFRGVLPFTIAMLFGIALLVAFPQISLFLPGMMK